MTVTLHLGDCLDVMATMADASVDSIVTDPPYGLEFMGKEWDRLTEHTSPSANGIYPKNRNTSGYRYSECDATAMQSWHLRWATAALRIAKPGAFLLAFGGTRTWHRLACAIEDAGWEIRDTVMWVYGSGFPKSHDISKAIDRAAGAEREVGPPNQWVHVMGRLPKDATTQVYGRGQTDKRTDDPPATALAAEWQGWGTALKPAWEPIIVAMKPLDGTFAANAEKWGVAGIWVDGGRVRGSCSGGHWTHKREIGGNGIYGGGDFEDIDNGSNGSPLGRWPANLIHDGSDEVVAGFPSAKAGVAVRRNGNHGRGTFPVKIAAGSEDVGYGDSGSAARFFQSCPWSDEDRRLVYQAKASRAERNSGIEGVMLELEMCLCSANEEHTEAVTLLERAISALVTEAEDREWNMTLFGNESMALCHLVTLSTMSMETSKTIGSKTWSVLTSLPTSAFIAGVIRTLQECGSSLVASAESISQSLNTTREQAASVRGAKIVVSETPLRISASAKPTVNFHPTCKPLSLMRYLVRLTKTPTGGVVLDPFMGSGTTGMACVLEGRGFIGIDNDADYYRIAEARIAHAQAEADKQSAVPTQLPLQVK